MMARAIDLQKNTKIFQKIKKDNYLQSTNIRSDVLSCVLDSRDSKYKFELASKERINCMCPSCCNGYLEKTVYKCTNEHNENDVLELELTTCTNYEHCDFVTHENIESKLSYKLIDEFIERARKAQETKKKNHDEKLNEILQENTYWNISKGLFRKSPISFIGMMGMFILALVISGVFIYNALSGDISQTLKASNKFINLELETTPVGK